MVDHAGFLSFAHIFFFYAKGNIVLKYILISIDFIIWNRIRMEIDKTRNHAFNIIKAEHSSRQHKYSTHTYTVYDSIKYKAVSKQSEGFLNYDAKEAVNTP